MVLVRNSNQFMYLKNQSIINQKRKNMKRKLENGNKMVFANGTLYRNLISLDLIKVLPSLPFADQDRIEQEILKNGIQFPLIIAKIGNLKRHFELVTGQFEYMMATKHDLPFNVIIKKFKSKADVIRSIITGTLNRLNLNTFQKCELVLKNKDVLVKKGRENMVMGGKGSKISENDKVDTMPQLAALIGISHDTLRKARYILNVLADDNDVLIQLRSGNMSINKGHEDLTGIKKTGELVKKNRDDIFPDFCDKELSTTDSFTVDSNTETESVIHSKFHINNEYKYQVIYIKPRWNLSSMIVLPDSYLEELQKMNICDIVNDKFCTLLIHTPSKYLFDTFKMIENWGFLCVDTICVSCSSKTYSSNYSDQNHEILLFCEHIGVGLPKSLISNRSSNSIIGIDTVFETINKMFDRNLSKICVFTEPIEGWDSYDFDKELNCMIKFHEKAA